MQWRFQLKGGLTKASKNFKFIFWVRGEITKNAYELTNRNGKIESFIFQMFMQCFDLAYKYVFSRE